MNTIVELQEYKLADYMENSFVQRKYIGLIYTDVIKHNTDYNKNVRIKSIIVITNNKFGGMTFGNDFISLNIVVRFFDRHSSKCFGLFHSKRILR
ncbi:hypothetical protein [Phocaeicola oris]|uniref:hypothetical protein n=1 Tax=Phocaeicola oris TaxID=2896850 RepID=UPI00234E57AE|nr:hypothetical protein [Phocaeicola oris]MCE2615522.1 hypothetical protein [Phocaeicola oris]